MNFVTWMWTPESGNRSFTYDHVNVLRAMLARHYPEPHKLICITDRTNGLDPRIEAFPMPVTGFEHLANPSGKKYKRMEKSFPSCYRRLWIFSDEARQLGDFVVQMDIDLIIVDSIVPLIEKINSTFVGWYDARFSWNKIAGGIFGLKTGAHTNVWTDFDPHMSPAIAAAAGNKGSDQAWMSYKLFPPPQVWDFDDGLGKIGWYGATQRAVPKGARIIFTDGHCPPWNPLVQKRYRWIRQHWRL